MKEEEWLTRREAADLLGIHYNTVRLWENRGRLTATRMKRGGVEEVRIPRAQVEAIIRDSDAVAVMRGADRLFIAKMHQIKAGEALPPAGDLLHLAQRLEKENQLLREKLTEVQRLESENKLLREELSGARRLAERLLDTIQAVSGQRPSPGDEEDR